LTESEASKEPQKVEEPKRKLSSLLSHPIVVIFTIIGLILTFTSFALSIYFYYAAKEYPQLTYYPHPVKATLVRAGEASRLITSFDNKPVETNITVAQIAIWNQGKRPIKKDQVLEPVAIFTENNTPILEATIRKSSREVTQLTLNTDDLQNGRVTVLWNILEQNDGGVIQLIYAGNADVSISADGILEGQSNLERLEFAGRIKSPYEQYESGRWEYRSLGYLCLILSGLLILGAQSLRIAKATYKKSFNDYLQSHQRRIDFFDGSIEGQDQLIAQTRGFIADVEEQAKDIPEGEDYKQLSEFSSQRIADYRREEQEFRERREKYESQKKRLAAETPEMLLNTQKQERLFTLFTLGVMLLAILAFAPAIYLLFIAQPIGPPFGF